MTCHLLPWRLQINYTNALEFFSASPTFSWNSLSHKHSVPSFSLADPRKFTLYVQKHTAIFIRNLNRSFHYTKLNINWQKNYFLSGLTTHLIVIFFYPGINVFECPYLSWMPIFPCSAVPSTERKQNFLQSTCESITLSYRQKCIENYRTNYTS